MHLRIMRKRSPPLQGAPQSRTTAAAPAAARRHHPPQPRLGPLPSRPAASRRHSAPAPPRSAAQRSSLSCAHVRAKHSHLKPGLRGIYNRRAPAGCAPAAERASRRCPNSARLVPRRCPNSAPHELRRSAHGDDGAAPWRRNEPLAPGRGPVRPLPPLQRQLHRDAVGVGVGQRHAAADEARCARRRAPDVPASRCRPAAPAPRGRRTTARALSARPARFPAPGRWRLTR